MTKTKKIFRVIILLLALLTLPFACAGAGTLYFGLTNTNIGLFKTEATLVNQSPETVFITPITTTYAEPRIIAQMNHWQHKNIPLKSGASLTLFYDAADSPMEGVALCRENGDCRFLENDWRATLSFSNLETLPQINDTWQAAIEAAPDYNLQALMMAGFVLTPLALLALWWRLGKSKESD